MKIKQKNQRLGQIKYKVELINQKKTKNKKDFKEMPITQNLNNINKPGGIKMHD